MSTLTTTLGSCTLFYWPVLLQPLWVMPGSRKKNLCGLLEQIFIGQMFLQSLQLHCVKFNRNITLTVILKDAVALCNRNAYIYCLLNRMSTILCLALSTA